MSTLYTRNQATVDRLTGELERLQAEVTAAKDPDAAELARRNARGAQARLDDYLSFTKDLAEEYPVEAEADELQARRDAPAKAARAARLRAERDEKLRSYPTMRGSFTRDKSVGADAPEFTN